MADFLSSTRCGPEGIDLMASMKALKLMQFIITVE